MFKKLIFNAILSIFLCIGAANAANPGQLQPNTLYGNPTGSIAPPISIPLNTAFSFSNGKLTPNYALVGSGAGIVYGTSTSQSGTTYTFASTDCGTTVFFTSSSAVTATIAASIAPAAGTTCNIQVVQGGTAKVSVNGTAVSAASLISGHSYTGTSGTQGSGILLTITTVSSTATAYLFGDGS